MLRALCLGSLSFTTLGHAGQSQWTALRPFVSATQWRVSRSGGALPVRRCCSATAGRRTPLLLRGGAKEQEEEEEEDDAAGEGLDDDGDDEDDFGAVSDADFDGDSLQGRALRLWEATPPLTQGYIGASAAITLFAFVCNGNQWPALLHLEWKPALARLQLWRLATGFLYLNPLGLGYVLMVQFVWTYMTQLEKIHHREPWVFVTMIGFGAAALLLATAVLGLNTQFLGHALSCFLVYVWARTYEGSEVNVMDVFNIKAELLPWFFAAQTYLVDGEVPVLDMIGIGVGHAYSLMEKKEALRAPETIKRWFLGNPALMARYEELGEEFGE